MAKAKLFALIYVIKMDKFISECQTLYPQYSYVLSLNLRYSCEVHWFYFSACLFVNLFVFLYLSGCLLGLCVCFFVATEVQLYLDSLGRWCLPKVSKASKTVHFYFCRIKAISIYVMQQPYNRRKLTLIAKWLRVHFGLFFLLFS